MHIRVIGYPHVHSQLKKNNWSIRFYNAAEEGPYNILIVPGTPDIKNVVK